MNNKDMPKEKEPNKKEPKRRSPFKDVLLLETEITSYINKFKSTIHTQANRMSDYFEMSCFNYIVKYYERNDYTVTIENLITKRYRYKCSPSGIQSNFSFFKVSKSINGIIYSFEIQHNLAVQSSHDVEIFTNPDISIINIDSCEYSTIYYDTNKIFSFVKNENLISFFEVKHFNPYPELVFNFMGVVNEIRKEIIDNTAVALKPKHLAPSLMISGKPNKQTLRIKNSLEKRYCINIIYDVFYSGATTFSRSNLGDLRTTGKV